MTTLLRIKTWFEEHDYTIWSSIVYISFGGIIVITLFFMPWWLSLIFITLNLLIWLTNKRL